MHVALVTGANHGIGAAIARALAAEGIAVLLTYLRLDDPVDPGIPDDYRRNHQRSADEVVAVIEAAGGRAAAIEADLTDPGVAVWLFDEAEERFGPVDVLVNNATGCVADTFAAAATDRLGRDLRSVSPETIDRIFGVDARASALLIAEFARRHLERGGTWGRIVGMTSGGPLGFPEEVTYGAAKAALENYTMSAALELADHGVTGNVVMPPVTDTGWVTDEVRDFVRGSREHFHVASPDDVAEVVRWLVSDEARLVTANRIVLR